MEESASTNQEPLAERLSRAAKILRIAAGVADEGIRLWAHSPRQYTLRVDHGCAARRAAEDQAFAESHPEIWTPPSPEAVRAASRIRMIHAVCTIEQGKGKGKPHQCRIAIDLDRRRINKEHTSEFLLSPGLRLSDAIGTAVFSLPFVLPLAPALLVARGARAWQEDIQQMSRHARALLKALKGQLDPETEGLLAEALRNDWLYEKRMARTVTLEQAKDLLIQCNLKILTVPPPEESTAFEWLDPRGDQVAYGLFKGTRGHLIKVLGTTFEDADADALTDCYLTKSVRDIKEH